MEKHMPPGILTDSKWGKWELEGSAHTLSCRGIDPPFHIELLDFGTTGQMLDCIFEVRQKNGLLLKTSDVRTRKSVAHLHSCDGFCAESTTITGISALSATSFSPSCSWSAVK